MGGKKGSRSSSEIWWREESPNSVEQDTR